jgi:hypothetical protein
LIKKPPQGGFFIACVNLLWQSTGVENRVIHRDLNIEAARRKAGASRLTTIQIIKTGKPPALPG